MDLLLTGLVLVSGLWWLVQALCQSRSARAVPRLGQLEAVPLVQWPRLSVIVPARNEVAHIADALAAKCAEGYPALELVVVNDRSTDATGEIADHVAASDPRVRVVHLDSLPEGWLGKVHALQRGLERATGEWILFSDADVHLAPGTLERLISWAERTGVDHIALMPAVHAQGPLLAPAIATFFRMFSALIPLWKVPDPRSTVAVGSGAFNLFRRRALDASPGLSWLKMEIGDDVALGVMLKRSGARQAVVIGGERVSLELYPNFPTLARALEKNGATTSMPAMVLASLILVALEAGFLAAPLAGSAWVAGTGMLISLLASITQWRVGRWLMLPRWPALIPCFGVLPLAAVIIRSAWLAFVRGGVTWRGTFYPTATVRAGERLRLRASASAPGAGQVQR